MIDDTEQVLLAYHSGDGAWVLPGGSVQLGESLREAVVREVVRKPAFRRSLTDRMPLSRISFITMGIHARFCLWCFRRRQNQRRLETSWGEPGEPIEDADWFEKLPEEIFEGKITKQVLEHVRERK